MTGFVHAEAGRWARRVPGRVPSVVIALPVCALTVATVAVVLLTAPLGTRSVALPVLLIGGGIVFAVALSNLAREVEQGYAVALIVGGMTWSVAALSASDDAVLYSVGRVSQWFMYLAITYLLLSYPAGRLPDRASRRLFAAAAAIAFGLCLPTVLIAQFPTPALWSNCHPRCPSNAFTLVHSVPLVQHVLVPVRELLTLAVFGAIAVHMTRRRKQVEPLLGHAYAPIVWLAGLEAISLVLYVVVRDAAPGAWALQPLLWVYLLAMPAIALAAAAGQLYRRGRTAEALDRIAHAVSISQTPTDVRRAMAHALHDGSLSILLSYPGDPESWVDESGVPVADPRAAAGRAVTRLADGDWRIAMVHDPVLSEDRPLLQAVGGYALRALENSHLSGQLHLSTNELARARVRAVASEDRERQKIERDLHDGAQQRLVAVRVKLGLAAGQLDERDPGGAALIRGLGDEIDATIDDVRAFASGIYPALLARTGLRDALRSISRSAALPTTVHADGLGRYAPEVEAAVYFSCSESLQNACKHARLATGVRIWVWEDQKLRFEIRDDGAGFDVANTVCGVGLSNLQDRLAAVDGTIAIESTPERGTAVTGSIPLP